MLLVALEGLLGQDGIRQKVGAEHAGIALNFIQCAFRYILHGFIYALFPTSLPCSFSVASFPGLTQKLGKNSSVLKRTGFSIIFQVSSVHDKPLLFSDFCHCELIGINQPSNLDILLALAFLSFWHPASIRSVSLARGGLKYCSHTC